MTLAAAGTWTEPRFTEHYDDWRARRLAAIRGHYGDAFFARRTVLELGCGYGDLGAAFSELGADVTCCDVRGEHLEVLRQRWPRLKAVQADLNREWPFGHFDVILHLGVLYHLESSHASLRQACRSCHHLVLETEVCDSNLPDLVVDTDEDGYDQAFDGRGCRPSPARVERILTEEGMRFERITDDRCNSGMHVYDWLVRDTGGFAHGLRRFWFAHVAPAAPIRMLREEQAELTRRLVAVETQLQRVVAADRPRLRARVSALVHEAVQHDLRVGIFGAGAHTSALLDDTTLRAIGSLFLFDNNPQRWGTTVGTLTVRPPHEIGAASLDVMLVSSLAFEPDIVEQLERLRLPGLRVVPCYADVAPASGDDTPDSRGGDQAPRCDV
jgi:SAM-dependent methyltransferase